MTLNQVLRNKKLKNVSDTDTPTPSYTQSIFSTSTPTTSTDTQCKDDNMINCPTHSLTSTPTTSTDTQCKDDNMINCPTHSPTSTPTTSTDTQCKDDNMINCPTHSPTSTPTTTETHNKWQNVSTNTSPTSNTSNVSGVDVFTITNMTSSPITILIPSVDEIQRLQYDNTLPDLTTQEDDRITSYKEVSEEEITFMDEEVNVINDCVILHTEHSPI